MRGDNKRRARVALGYGASSAKFLIRCLGSRLMPIGQKFPLEGKGISALMAMHRIPYRRTHIFMVCPVFRIGAYQTLWMLGFVPHRQPTGLPKIKCHELFVHQLA